MNRFTAFIIIILFGLVPAISLCQHRNPSQGQNHADLTAWNDPKYLAANTAKNVKYLTSAEKQVFYYLNLVRMNPKLFADTYLKDLNNSDDEYESSLYTELQNLKPLPVLTPDRKLYESARCHAEESGKRGFVGHERFNCKEDYMGECIYYGQSDALDIVTELLVDKGVKSLGHRKIMLDTFTLLGVSIQPHKTYGENCVMDFR